MQEDINVILIDWCEGAVEGSYKEAADNVVEVGKRTAELIETLIDQVNVTSTSIWCVGHSLGAHICGYAGLNLQSWLQKKLGRITGLDPAGPLFEDKPNRTVGLNSTCAQFVDVIHTDVELFGTRRNLGHIDFYPQGYKYAIDLSQEGLANSQVICGDVCSHSRSIDFMKISINNKCFISTEHCSSYDSIPGSCTADATCPAYMGYDAGKSCNKTGILYLKVAPHTPFCLNNVTS